MAVEWAQPIEAPTSLDAQRVIGTRGRRGTLWALAAIGGSVPMIVAAVMFPAAGMLEEAGVPRWISEYIGAVLLVPTAIWLLICYVMGNRWGGRYFEYWAGAWWRSVRLPRTLEGASLVRHHAPVEVIEHHLDDGSGYEGAVVEVGTINLRMTADVTLGSHTKKFHAFLVGLRWPVQIVVRAWRQSDGTIVRRWFIAVQAETGMLDKRAEEVITGLKRAGLDGRRLNGDLFATLQVCWSRGGAYDRLGPRLITREREHVDVDGEKVRGLLLARTPRTVNPNWLAPLLDGDKAVDLNMWLDPLENSVAQDELLTRINEWESSQILRANGSGGYRDAGVDEQIKDAQRTLAQLRRPGALRLFYATISLLIRADTVEDLGRAEADVVNALREHCGPDPVIPLDFEQDRAPLIGVPTGQPPVLYPLRLVTPVLARCYPFSNSSMEMAGGISCGTSVGSQRDNKLDVWALTNPHMVILATSGAGKGYWLKVYLKRLLDTFPGRRVWIIQAEKDEYRQLAQSLPPYRYAHPDLASDPRLTGTVITFESLSDLHRVWWYEPSHVLAGGQLTVYDLTRMRQGDKGKAVAYLLEAIDLAAQCEHRETLGHVVVDELGIVLRDAEAAQAIETGYRRFRSIPHRADPTKISRRGMIGVSQRPSDLLMDVRGSGKVIADLSETHVYLRQKATELEVTKDRLRLSPDESDYLELAEDGDGLLVAGRSRVAFHLYASTDEHVMART
jgi:hypothetical protein